MLCRTRVRVTQCHPCYLGRWQRSNIPSRPVVVRAVHTLICEMFDRKYEALTTILARQAS